VRTIAGAFVAVALLGVQAAPSPSPVPDDPQAEQIFHAARVAWSLRTYPRYATYVVNVAYTKNRTQLFVRHYDTYEDLHRNLVYARTLSGEERAHPQPSFGFTFMFQKKVPDDPLGSFAIAINNDYGVAIGSKPIAAVNDSFEAAQSSDPLADDNQHGADNDMESSTFVVIGRTQTTDRTYAVHLIETLDEADERIYHLGLTPLRNPQRNRLRELWVDAKTSLVKRALVSAAFNRAPLDKVPWLVDYHVIDGAPYIAQEAAQAPLNFGKAGTVTGVTVSFEDVTPLSTIPINLAIGITTPPDVTDTP
jgi:hypothetical protein